MLSVVIENDHQGHLAYDAQKEKLTSHRLFRHLDVYPDMFELVQFCRSLKDSHGIRTEILTATGSINREIVVKDKREWIDEWVDPNMIVNCVEKGRFRETQPAMGQELQDTVPGSGSGDQ